MSYTHTNLRSVTDAAVAGGFSEHQDARFATGDLDAEDTGIAMIRIKPGKRSAFGHRHENAEEVYVVLSGSGRMKLDDDVIELRPLDAVRMAPQVTRALEAGPDGLEILAVGPRHQGDGELAPDFWAD